MFGGALTSGMFTLSRSALTQDAEKDKPESQRKVKRVQNHTNKATVNDPSGRQIDAINRRSILNERICCFLQSYMVSNGWRMRLPAAGLTAYRVQESSQAANCSPCVSVSACVRGSLRHQ